MSDWATYVEKLEPFVKNIFWTVKSPCNDPEAYYRVMDHFESRHFEDPILQDPISSIGVISDDNAYLLMLIRKFACDKNSSLNPAEFNRICDKINCRDKGAYKKNFFLFLRNVIPNDENVIIYMEDAFLRGDENHEQLLQSFGGEFSILNQELLDKVLQLVQKYVIPELLGSRDAKNIIDVLRSKTLHGRSIISADGIQERQNAAVSPVVDSPPQQTFGEPQELVDASRRSAKRGRKELSADVKELSDAAMSCLRNYVFDSSPSDSKYVAQPEELKQLLQRIGFFKLEDAPYLADENILAIAKHFKTIPRRHFLHEMGFQESNIET